MTERERERENSVSIMYYASVTYSFVMPSVLHRKRERENELGHILITHLLVMPSVLQSQTDRERENELGYI